MKKPTFIKENVKLQGLLNPVYRKDGWNHDDRQTYSDLYVILFTTNR